MRAAFNGKTEQEAQLVRNKWADYCRMRMRPDKECIRCKKILPNTRENFSSPSGHVRRVCRECQASHTSVAAKRSMAGPKHADCPMCEELSALVLDWKAPGPVRVCRRCLLLINQMSILASVGWLEKAKQYMEWRQGTEE